jgi:hypothetical protein
MVPSTPHSQRWHVMCLAFLCKSSKSGVGSGSPVFGIGAASSVLDEYRSSLHPELVQALFFAKEHQHLLSILSLNPDEVLLQIFGS